MPLVELFYQCRLHGTPLVTIAIWRYTSGVPYPYYQCHFYTPRIRNNVLVGSAFSCEVRISVSLPMYVGKVCIYHFFLLKVQRCILLIDNGGTLALRGFATKVESNVDVSRKLFQNCSNRGFVLGVPLLQHAMIQSTIRALDIGVMSLQEWRMKYSIKG